MSDDMEKSKRYILGVKYPDIYFREREARILFALLRGKSVFEIAAEMGCALRTINFYIESMMNALSCHTVNELIRCVRETEFMKYL